MELVFLALLVLLMATALGSGFPVAFALPGSAIVTVVIAAAAGWLFAGSMDAYFAQGGPGNWLSAGVTNLRGIYWEPERDTLIAIPLFIFMGIMLQRSKIAEDLLVTMAQLFGPIRGGLGISVVFVGALLAATTGIVGATVVAMGLISLPAMMRNNYSNSLASGTIAASGTLGQIIPPSIVLIILADQLASATDQASTLRKNLFKDNTGELSMPSEFDVSSTSAGEMFLGALIPGLVLVALYMLFIFLYALIRPGVAPAVHSGERFDTAFWIKVSITLVPPLALIVMVLGSILGGIATVNQAGAIGAAGALIMAGYRLSDGKRLAFAPAVLALISLGAIAYAVGGYDTNIKNIQSEDDAFGVLLAAIGVGGVVLALIWSGIRTLRIDRTLQGVMIETAKTTSLVFIILLGAAMLTAAFRAFGGEELVKHFLETLPGGFWTQFVIVMLVIFVLGFFLDFIEIAVVVVPIVAPILLADPGANITAVWLGVMVGLNIQTSFLTPPFGFALFYLRGVAPAAVRTVQIYKGVIPFIALQLLALVIVGYLPSLVNYLPLRVSLTSETAPPPINPRLQACLEEYKLRLYADQAPQLQQSIATARSLQLELLPEDLAEDLRDGLDKADAVFAAVAEIEAAKVAVAAATADYAPLHRQVRDIERQIRQHAAEVEDINRRIRDLGFGEADNSARIAALEARLEANAAEVEALRATIPADWPERHDAFAELLAAEERARNSYRRTADDAYEPLIEVQALITQADAVAALRPDVEALAEVIRNADGDTITASLEEVEGRLGALEGVSDIRSPLSQARRLFRRGAMPRDEALELHAEALAALDAEAAWRQAAQGGLAEGLQVYDETIRGSIGLRMQPRLEKDLAEQIAACMSHHRDVSLHF